MVTHRRLFEVVAAMAAVCLASAGIALAVLYETALDEQRRRLAEALEGQVRLIDAIARSQASDSGLGPESVKQATLRQVLDAHRRSRGFGRTGELVLAKREGDEIVFTLNQRGDDLPPIPADGARGEPMRRAVAGETGSCTCLDHRSDEVLAVFAPVTGLGMGAVAKISLAEIRAPFVRAAGTGGGVAALAIAISAWLLARFANPLIGSLEASEARNRAILEGAAEGILTANDRGLVESLNPAAARIFGYAPAEVVGRPMSLLLPPTGAEPGAAALGAAAVPGMGREVVGRRKDGAPRPVEIAVSDVRLHKGRLVTVIVRDLAERRRSEREKEELRQAAERNARLAEIGALSAKIVHDLGNPLGGLSMQAQLVQRLAARGADAEAIGKAVGDMTATLRHVDALIRQFRSFARGQRLELDSIDVAGFVAELVRFWAPEAARRGIALRGRADDGIAALRADPAKLRRVLDNLVKNAIEAIDEPAGEVRVEAHVAGPGRVRLSVADTGPGIPPDVQVFRLFETTKPDGSGIGLPVSREIVLAHGGSIDYHPLEPRGTAFHVELPIEGPAA